MTQNGAQFCCRKAYARKQLHIHVILIYHKAFSIHVSYMYTDTDN